MPETIQLTQKDNGRSLNVRKGDEIEICLYEQFSGGYQWFVAEQDEKVLPNTSTHELAPEESACGSESPKVFCFRAVCGGRSHTLLKHFRQWEGESSAIEQFAVDVTVSG